MTSTPSGRLPRLSVDQLSLLMSQRDSHVLSDVGILRLVYGKQLQRMHFGDDEAAARAARRCLLRLVKLGVLVRLPRTVGGVRAGSSGHVFAVGPAGDRLLGRGGQRTRSSEIRDGFLTHTLAIADLYVAVVTEARRGTFDVVQIETEPRTWRQLGGLTQTDWLKPDLHVVLGVGELELSSWVEYETGSQHAPALLRKLRQYERAYQQSHAELVPKVVWLMPTQRRAEQLRQLIRRTRDVTDELHVVGVHDEAMPLLTGIAVTTTNKEGGEHA